LPFNNKAWYFKTRNAIKPLLLPPPFRLYMRGNNALPDTYGCGLWQTLFESHNKRKGDQKE